MFYPFAGNTRSQQGPKRTDFIFRKNRKDFVTKPLLIS